jgi:hypothetical protein
MSGGVRRGDPDTSHEASDNAPVYSLQAKYLMALYRLGPLTTEIGRYWDLPRDSMSPRTPDLTKKGLVVYMGKKACRNPSGRITQMKAWALTDLGRATVKIALDAAEARSRR